VVTRVCLTVGETTRAPAAGVKHRLSLAGAGLGGRSPVRGILKDHAATPQERAMPRIERPFFHIIYVRGYAMTRDEIVQTTSTPYMGFEAGSTKIRQAQDGSIVKFVFESPLVRLMKDYCYREVYPAGAEQLGTLPARSLVIHRYYDEAD